MVNNNSEYFYLSGLISFGMFFMFIGVFLTMMLKSDKIKQFAINKDTFISISIDPPKSKPKNKKVVKEIEKKILKQVIDPVDSQEFDIDDMFSDVQTKDVKIHKEEPKRIDAKRLQAINKKILTTKENKIEKIEQIKEVKSKSSALEVNEYFARIQSTVYESFFPPKNSQGHTVKAVIELNSLGKVLDFRILTYSANSSLNEECDKIKERLLGINFPINPDNLSGSYIIKLTAKE